MLSYVSINVVSLDNPLNMDKSHSEIMTRLLMKVAPKVAKEELATLAKSPRGFLRKDHPTLLHMSK